MSSSCWTPNIRSSRSTILLKFGSKVPLKKLRNLSLSLGTEPWLFFIWPKSMDSLRLASSKFLKTLIRRSGEQQELAKEMQGCLLAMTRLWRIRKGCCLARLQYWTSSNHLQGLIRRHLYCWTLEMIQVPRLEFNRKCLLLKLPLVCNISYVLQISRKYIYFLLVKIIL
jgi:hypothetical protein